LFAREFRLHSLTQAQIEAEIPGLVGEIIHFKGGRA
jgi:hypothetical protein